MTRMTDQIGRVLGGRYRLLSPLGSGASAQVYLADDVRLRRRVAVKVLHPALADDESFLRRFRAEAQAAAALSHPHLLAVYDWSDDDRPFLVTEYLAGGSLRAMLDAGHRLSPAQALVVGLEAARALDHAHRHGFVHRDIKPANLLFGDDGRLRVADFGLARAIAEAGWTEPTGAVLGTARYASPEQARGEALDGRSDVYSLALVLVEAVTGEVPFTADTTIGTLMARLDRSLDVPAELGPLAPALLGAGGSTTTSGSTPPSSAPAWWRRRRLVPPGPAVPRRPHRRPRRGRGRSRHHAAAPRSDGAGTAPGAGSSPGATGGGHRRRRRARGRRRRCGARRSARGCRGEHRRRPLRLRRGARRRRHDEPRRVTARPGAARALGWRAVAPRRAAAVAHRRHAAAGGDVAERPQRDAA